ncbi:(2Fe-2S)-binding protein [Pseudoduganella sp. LjRoot289]|uniref:(2Fe-2S)-binding protein n=1 Tax=Pseudoduganella sp. LjRoot289 TaxID=3342314 RepID=UPI003ECD307F
MTELATLAIDGRTVTVPAGTTVVAAIAVLHAGHGIAAGTAAGVAITRRSVAGMLRGPVCGMGVCQECRVTIDGRAHQLACLTLCASGMQVLTALADDAA